MNKNCKNCKFWGNEQDALYADNLVQGFEYCRKVGQYWVATTWKYRDDPVRDAELAIDDEHKNEKAFVQDGSDYSADFITRHDFCCNQWEQKDR